MRATVCGHHVRQRNDEKLADLRSETLIMWDKSPSPPRSVFHVQEKGAVGAYLVGLSSSRALRDRKC